MISLELPQHLRGKRVALVHDWLNGMRGGERVLEEICQIFPGADLFTLLYEEDKVSETIAGMNVVESSFAQLPGARTQYRSYLPLLHGYVSKFPTADYDLVLSTSHCVAKAALRPREGLHLSYVFSPMRYIWDHFQDYLGGGFIKDNGLRVLRKSLQKKDQESCREVDYFAADSAHIAKKIEKFWGRKADVIYPSAQTDFFTPCENSSPTLDYFLVVSAFVPYKKVDRAIRAANEGELPLVIAGGGPEEDWLKSLAGPTVHFAGKVSDEELRELYRNCKALLYPGIEDFGITALEAMACGRPVLGLYGGGVAETVIDGETGGFFHEESTGALKELMESFDEREFDSSVIRKHAERFSQARFRDQLMNWISQRTRFLR